MTIRTHKIASIGADGIGPEVVEAGLEVLEALSKADGGFALDVQRFDWGSERYRRVGAFMPEDGLAQLRKHFEFGGHHLTLSANFASYGIALILLQTNISVVALIYI